jgi:hypothetical protein
LSLSRKIVDGSASFSVFYSDIQFLAELSRTLVSRDYDKRIRDGTFQNVAALTAAIKNYIDTHNQNPQVFVWTAPVESILTKISKCKEALDALY